MNIIDSEGAFRAWEVMLEDARTRACISTEYENVVNAVKDAEAAHNHINKGFAVPYPHNQVLRLRKWLEAYHPPFVVFISAAGTVYVKNTEGCSTWIRKKAKEVYHLPDAFPSNNDDAFPATEGGKS